MLSHPVISLYTLLVSTTHNTGSSLFGQLPGGSRAALSADGGGRGAARGGDGGAAYDVDEGGEHGEVHYAQHDLEEPVGRAEAVHD